MVQHCLIWNTTNPLVVSLHKQLVRNIYIAAVLVLITIAMGDSDGIIVCETATRAVLLTNLANRLKLLIHDWRCSSPIAQLLVDLFNKCSNNRSL